jgi:hypothetical protein
MRSEPLYGERGLRLGAVARQPLANQAELERRDVVVEHTAEEPLLAERSDERPVDATGLAFARDGVELVLGELLRAMEELEVLGSEVRVGGYAITAVPTSSTFAASSNSALTPSRATAG